MDSRSRIEAALKELRDAFTAIDLAPPEIRINNRDDGDRVAEILGMAPAEARHNDRLYGFWARHDETMIRWTSLTQAEIKEIQEERRREEEIRAQSCPPMGRA